MSEDDDRDDRVVGFHVSADAVHGLQGGFFGVRRVRLRNRRADGSHSAEYECDFVLRPKGIDAVVVAIFRRREDDVLVLLRECLRPAIALGRPAAELPVADPREYVGLTEVVAGIIEKDDIGEAGIRARAAIEVKEEAGLVVPASRVFRLGASTFPSPGSIPERYHLVAVEVDGSEPVLAAEGDGSPMEEGATTRWMALDDAIEACVAGEIEDAKTELSLRRLRDHLRRGS